VNLHGFQGINLFGYPHDAQFSSHGRTGPGRYHDGGKHRSQFPDQGHGNGRAQGRLGPETDQGVIPLQPQYHACKHGSQDDDEHGFATDKPDLLHNFCHLKRRNKGLNQAGE